MRSKLLLFFLFSLPLLATNYGSYQDWCQIGGQYVTTAAVNSSNQFQQSYPNCTITVYISGSGGTLATLYSNYTGTPLSNPFTAQSNGFFQFFTNATVDIQRSGGGLPAPYTVFGVTITDNAPSGLTGSVQYNLAGNLTGDNNLVWFPSLQFLQINGINTTQAALFVNNGAITAGGIIKAELGVYPSSSTINGVSSLTDGINVIQYQVLESGTTPGSVGGSVHFTPIQYYPNGRSTPCFDTYGNVVTQPSPLNGESVGSNDLWLWESTSPSMPADGSCGTSIPVNGNYGLNTNGYIFARAGLDSDSTSYNAIQTFNGGVTSQSFTAGGFYNTGTVTKCCGTLTQPTYLGGYMQVGFSQGPPSAGTIATAYNPLTNDDGVETGTLYFDTTLNCLNVYNGSAWACAGGGGGGGTPGGSNTQVQFNSSGAFGGSADMTWNNSTKVLEVGTGGTECSTSPTTTCYITAINGFTTTNIYYNSIQAPSGGVDALSVFATNYIQSGSSSGVPTKPAGATIFLPGAMYYDTGSACEELYNGTAWTCMSSGSGAPGGATTNVQFNAAGSFGGSADFTWNNSTDVLAIGKNSTECTTSPTTTCYITAENGFATVGTYYNAVNVPSGGVSAYSVYASAYMQSGFGTAIPSFPTGASIFEPGALYYNTTSGCEEVYNGTTWTCLTSGGTGTPGGTNTAVQFNNAGAFGGSTNFQWTNSTQQLVIVGASPGAETLQVTAGYIEADAGFASIGTTYNTIQAPNGGVDALAVFATNYMQSGSFAAGAGVISPPTKPAGATIYLAGAMFYNTSVGCEEVYSGSSWGCLAGGGGGVTSLNSLTGALSIASSNLNITPSGSTVTINTPQSVATTASPSFANINAAQYSSTASSTASGFLLSNGNFALQGNGNATFLGVVILSGSASGLNVVSNSDTNSIQTSGGVNSTLGYFTPSTNFNSIQSNGGINIGATGSSNGVVDIDGITVLAYNAGNPSGTFAGGISTGNGNFALQGNGNATFLGVVTLSGASSGLNVISNTATNSIQTSGGMNATIGYFTPSTNFNSIQSNGGINIGATGSSNGVVDIDGITVLAYNGGAPSGTFLGGISTGSSSNSIIYIGSGGAFYDYSFSLYPTSGQVQSVLYSGLSCSGVADGWTGYNLATRQYFTCQGGIPYSGGYGTPNGGYSLTGSIGGTTTLPTCSYTPTTSGAHQVGVGALVYCVDCKNNVIDGVAFDSVATNSGHGTNVLCEGTNSGSPHWTVH